MSTNITLADPVVPQFDNAYDEVPYESYPYPQSHPSHLYTVGKLFGMQPVLPGNARVLELGCASGGNCIPLAISYPKAKIIAIDLSKVHIDNAKKQAEDLKLENVDFRWCSIMDVDKSFGEFDYIIAHGILSWVPEEVRKKIFDISKELLSSNGISYISYNALPGWNMVRSIRDMMRYHSDKFSTRRQRLQQARSFLQFVSEGLEGSNTPYANFLRQESNLLMRQGDSYVCHDHLEESNHQFYFHEFMQYAVEAELAYLGDASVSSMYVGNMPQKVIEKLSAINDIVQTEQYMDFINNRRFRSTLLCRKDIKLDRHLTNERLKDFYLTFNIIPEKPLSEVNLEDFAANLKFYFNNNKDNSLSTSSPAMKAILYTFHEHYGVPVKIDQIVKSAHDKLPSQERTHIKNELLNNAMRFVLSGHMNLHSETFEFPKKPTDKPKLSDLALYQAQKTNQLWVTNTKRESVQLNLFSKYVLRYLDGTNDFNTILEKMIDHVKNKELTLSKDGKKVEEEETIRSEIKVALEQTLNHIAESALLVS